MIVLAKLAIAPVLLLLCALAVKRWGGVVGGVLLGLPVVSGPTSAIMFAEHGAEFARTSARTAILGLVATAVFCHCYSVLAEREGWRTSLVAGYAGCLGSVWLFAHTHVEFGAAVLFAAGALALIARMTDLRETARPTRTLDMRELALRALLAIVSVWLVTSVGTMLGARVAGLLAPLPVLAAVMTVRTHRDGERVAARSLLRGTVLGSWGGAGFFTAVGLLLGHVPVPVAYLIAVASAIGAVALALSLSNGSLRINAVGDSWSSVHRAHLDEGNGSVAISTGASMHVLR